MVREWDTRHREYGVDALIDITLGMFFLICEKVIIPGF